MMSFLAPIISIALPWVAGCALLLILGWPGRRQGDLVTRAAGRISLVLGYGYFIGLLLLTGWMRLLSVGIGGFGRWTIVAPLVLLAAAAIVFAFRRFSLARAHAVATAILRPAVPGWQRLVWLLLLSWLALRLGTLAIEVGSRPLYAWDAWAEWAPKARVWFELGRMAPFVPGSAWLAGAPGAYFDPAPGNPATISLLQAWSAIVLGRWDDSALDWPWLFMLIALALATYGMLREGGVGMLGALIGAYLVASLPLTDVHVALAGYADLMLCGAYTLSALALFRWAATRGMRDAVIAVGLALACPAIASSGVVWMLTLASGAIVVLWPRRGPKALVWACGGLALAVLAIAGGPFSDLTPRLDYVSPWRALEETLLFADNWHLLWYGAIVLAIVGGRKLLRPRLAPVTMVLMAAIAWLLGATMFSGGVGHWFAEARLPARAGLIVAPLLVFAGMLLWRELLARQAATESEPVKDAHPALAVDA
jgi:hypothetical protein